MLRSVLLLRTLLTNWVVAATLGTALAGVLFYGQPGLVLGIDIAGVPVVVYAAISTAIPVLLATACGHAIFALVSSLRTASSARIWVVTGMSLGALAGGLTALVLVRAVGMVVAGVFTGATCGALQGLAWWRAARKGVVERAA